MRSVLIFCFSIFLINAFGQQVRYVDGFKRTVDEEKATYHQVIYTDSLLSNSVLIKMFDKSGLLIDAGYYDKSDLSIKNGPFTQYFENGKIDYICTYTDNKRHGEFTGYYPSGQIRRREIYHYDSLISGKCFGISGNDTTYFPRIKQATFNNGKVKDFSSFLKSNTIYPLEARQRKIQGTVYAYIVVSKEGKVVESGIYKSPHPLLTAEVERIIRKSRKYWGAGLLEGEPVNSMYHFPVKFTLKNGKISW